jgi:hypothetical protein
MGEFSSLGYSNVTAKRLFLGGIIKLENLALVPGAGIEPARQQ